MTTTIVMSLTLKSKDNREEREGKKKERKGRAEEREEKREAQREKVITSMSKDYSSTYVSLGILIIK